MKIKIVAYKIKVCGMKYPDNIQEVADCDIDFMGFIFYEKSKRFVSDLPIEVMSRLEGKVKKVGVFVNHSAEYILAQAKKYSLDILQLHGDESVEQCKELKAKGFAILKVFQADAAFDFSVTLPYKPFVDYFMFDTKSEGYGGTGKRFDWSLLEKYDNEVPLFLSGGLSLELVEDIKSLKGLNIYALDLNSKFEKEAAVKDVKKIKAFIAKVK